MELPDLSTPEDGAAYWDARLRSPECTAHDRAAFARWRDSAPENRAAFEALQSVIHVTRAARHRPEIRAISNAAIAMIRQRPRAWFWWSTAAAVIVATPAAWWGHQLFDSMTAPDGLRIATEVNDHRELELADGSKVTLGARSQLTVRIDDGSRKLWLESGQAYFEVAKDEARPFVVHADGGTITAMGTGFDVHQIGQQVTVTVVEGSVQVESLPPMSQPDTDGSRPPEFPTTSLKEGQSLGFGEVFTPIETVDPESALAWRGGYLNYSGQPLSEVIADVQRYTKKQLVLADEEVGKLEFRGTVYRNNVQDWLERLDESLPVEVEFPNRRTVILRSSPAP